MEVKENYLFDKIEINLYAHNVHVHDVFLTY